MKNKINKVMEGKEVRKWKLENNKNILVIKNYHIISLPSITGTFAACIIFLLVLLMPISLIAEEGGPTNMIPSLAHKVPNSTFSERKP